ncbi:hypothetical protein F9C11_20435 [Amycolatopsis sp. VS8301801F10]|uniref:hypothetical protein n=1 Tax=unclassified Amycolatopsis TaxID=2618356 RepID=UPI0038FCBDA9
MADGFTFYRYLTGNPPYRRTPTGRFEQFSIGLHGWMQCNQNDRGLTRIAPAFLPSYARPHAYAPAVDTRARRVREGSHEQ